jgi:hypothetical protein
VSTLRDSFETGKWQADRASSKRNIRNGNQFAALVHAKRSLALAPRRFMAPLRMADLSAVLRGVTRVG